MAQQNYLDKDGVLYFWQKIKSIFATKTEVGDKVDKVNGKGLSTNDYTTAEKTKLTNIASGAQVNVIETVKKNGTALTITDKTVDISVPTKTSDITNDSGFITIEDVPDGAVASTTSPKMDGTATIGTETAFARGDHIHPSDTTRVPTSRKVAGHALTADVTLAKGDVGLGNVDNTSDANKPVSTAQQTALDEKVDKVDGKGLSTNDYTTAEKTKLAGIDEGAKKVSYRPYSLEYEAYLTGVDKSTTSNIYTHVSYDSVELIGSDNTKLKVLDESSALSMLNNKVDKVTGKGLSTNDYTTAEKNKLASFGSADTYALKTDITGMYKYKGSVATVSALPSTGNTTGDVYNVESSGMNYAWNGTAWDSLGEIFQITSITNAEIDTIVAS